MGRAIGELKLAIRALRRAPLHAALAIGALGLGIGGAVTVFSAVNAAFLRALPYPDADRLVSLWQRSLRSQEIAVAYPVVADWAARLKEAEQLAGYMGPGDTNAATERGGPGSAARVIPATRVTASFFETLGVRPFLGRAFTPEEVRPGGPRVAVISYDVWQQVFGGSTDVVSRALSIEGATVPVIGVLPQGATFPEGTGIWTSLDADPGIGLSRTAHNLRVIARRRAGVSASALEASLAALQGRLETAYPEMREGLGVRVVPLRTQLLGTSGDALWLLFGSVGLVLLIACANVANLLLARATGREVESAVRRALGADRLSLAAPLLAEGLVVSFAGTAIGLAIAFWGQTVLAAVLPPTLVAPEDLAIDARVMAFAVVSAALTGILCSVVPALAAGRVDLRHVLSTGSRSVAGGSQRTMRAFVAVQIALACVLLASAALFARGLARLEQIDPGFDADRVMYATFAIGSTAGSVYESSDARVAFFKALLERVNGVSGVRSAGLTTDLPFGFSPNGGIEEEGAPPDLKRSAHFRLASPRYFETLGIPLRMGRHFSDQDSAGRPLVAIVNETAVRTLWNGDSPIGRRVRMPGMDGEAAWYTIVGVVGDIRHRGLTREPVAEAYFPFEQRPQRTWGMQLVVRVQDDSSSRRLTEAIAGIDPRVPVTVRTLDTLVDRQVQPTRLRARLVASFGLTALTLSMIGIFGVMSYFVTRRTREVGVRMALGADRSRVQRLVIARALTPVAVGLGAGLILTIAASRLVESVLPAISPRDPVALGAALISLATSAAVAAWWPARRASRLDPIEALRE